MIRPVPSRPFHIFITKHTKIMNNEFLKMQKLAGIITESQYNQKTNMDENKAPSDIEEFLDGMINTSMPEDADEGEQVDGVWEMEEYGDEEAYGEEADMFKNAHEYIETQGGSIVIPGNPDVTYTAFPGGDIGYSLVVTLG
jgi:hypothetical protein